MAPAHLSYLGKIQTEVSIDDPPRATRSSSIVLQIFQNAKDIFTRTPKNTRNYRLGPRERRSNAFLFSNSMKTGISLGNISMWCSVNVSCESRDLYPNIYYQILNSFLMRTTKNSLISFLKNIFYLCENATSEEFFFLILTNKMIISQ